MMVPKRSRWRSVRISAGMSRLHHMAARGFADPPAERRSVNQLAAIRKGAARLLRPQQAAKAGTIRAPTCCWGMTRDVATEPLEAITIEPETRGDSRSLFRVFFNHRLLADQLTAAEAHGLIGDLLERAALPNRAATIPLESLNASNDE